jgi:DedD protein
MEKKKLLLVAVAVGIVLLIIIGIPLMMIAPRQRPASPLQSSLPNVERDWGTAVEPAAQRTQSAVEPPAYTGGAQSREFTYSEPVEAPHITTLTVPVPETAAVPNTPITQARKPSTVKLTADQSAAPANSSDIKSVAVAVKSAPVSKSTAKPPMAKAAANSAKTHNNYWVQTGAFSTKIRAEGAKESLASKGIASVIDNRDIDGKTWYRVRVGPYISETEANYWLALVKSIDGFAESQIRLTQAVQ